MIELLSKLIATPSLSRQESATADILAARLLQHGFEVHREHNNIWVLDPLYTPERPTLMLNSHHDTVRPAAGYTRDPFTPTIEGDRLYGLGSNDAGASLVALTQTFIDMAHDTDRNVNLLLALSAEEEVTGEHGMRALLPAISEAGVNIGMAIVGEPTGMQPAVGERGLVVLDGECTGRSGHAARSEGVNALYLAIDDICRLRDFRFERTSQLLGPIGVNVTMIEAGTQHNVVPDRCRYTIDVRTTDAYTNEETVELLRAAAPHSTLTPRSTRLRASAIAMSHPLVRSAQKLGLEPFVSSTMSDMAVMHSFPSMKIGPGDSARSHSADEYILLSELLAAPAIYRAIISNLR